MNSDMLMGLFRAVIPGMVAALTHYGIGTDAQDTLVATAAATGLVAAWSAYSNTPREIIRSVNTADNGVKVVASTVAAPTETAPLK